MRPVLGVVSCLPWLIMACAVVLSATADLSSGGAPADRLVQNGWIVWRGQAVWGWVQHNGWWRDGQRPNITRRSVSDSLGDVRPNRTEDLDRLTDNMLLYGYPGFEHNFGLWYDRRRDRHDVEARTTPECRPPFLEQPWARGRSGQAADGLPKYDLTRFNDWYFARLKRFADLCDAKGTVLLFKPYMQHALLEQQTHYVDFPWRPGNCIQDVRMPDVIPAANSFYDVSHAERARLHRLYIAKCLDVLGGNRNVVFLIGQEFTGPIEFARFYVDAVLDWQRRTGKHVCIGVGATKDVTDAILADPVRGPAVDVIDMRCWWVRRDGTVNAMKGGAEAPGRDTECGTGQTAETSTQRFYEKVRHVRDRHPRKALIDALVATRQDSWAFLMAGGSLLVRGQIEYPGHVDPPAYVKPAEVDFVLPTYRMLRERLGPILPRMVPCDIAASTSGPAWCLASPGSDYLVYAMHGGTLTLDLSKAASSRPLTGRWFDPRTGTLSSAFSVPASANVDLHTPDDQDWALVVSKQ